jgi:molybdopterin-synthase adenylyltransferase
MTDEIAELATLILEERGFALTAKGVFEGKLNIVGVGQFSAKVVLPSDFPNKLPEIFLVESELPRPIAHVFEKGQVCIANTSGVLLDRSNPAGIICESIDRAQEVLRRGLAGESDPDLLSEILAYWNRRALLKAISIVEPNSTVRPIVLSYAPNESVLPRGNQMLLAENAMQARSWAERFHVRCLGSVPSFYLPLRRELDPQIALDLPSPTVFLDQLQHAADPKVWSEFRNWLRRVVLPVTVLISLPLGVERAVFAVEFVTTGKGSKGGAYVFRKGQIRAADEIARTPSVQRYQIDRFDSDFVLPRGGADVKLAAKTIVIVGCGAIGSFVAKFLALAGVGGIRLIDWQVFTNENIHRHLLGADAVGHNKAEELARILSSQFPSTTFEFRDRQVEVLLHKEKDFVLGDELVNATGDETLGLNLNENLRESQILLHTWNDPMGIGGHVLATFPGSHGCYECLFVNDVDAGVLHNSAGFGRANQEVARTFSGCAGVFVPFSALDAVRTATECAALTVSALTGHQKDPVLVSWFGDSTSFVNAGFELSRRSGLFSVGEIRRESTFARTDCVICGAQK